MQEHIKRALTLLGIVIVCFLIVRTIIVPRSFGEYGWFRGNSINDIMNFKVEHSDPSICVDCHKNVYTVWSNGSHSNVSCDDCHGPTQGHVKDNSIMPTPANESREFCGLCHFNRTARPSNFPQIDPNSGHGEGLNCTYCHNPHKPWFV